MSDIQEQKQRASLTTWIEGDVGDECWIVKCTDGIKKEKILVWAESASVAAEIAEDYLELWATSVKALGYLTIISRSRAQSLADEMQERLSQDE
jgi:hypothetical protein